MTFEQQVQEIIKLMSPEDPGTQTDAYFLVQRYMAATAKKLSDKDKQIAILEARLEDERKRTSDITNEKLQAEDRLMKEKAELASERDKQPPKDKPKGKTL